MAGRSVLAVLCALFFSSGALALIYEVLWQRQFALVFGSAAPAMAAVLAAYFAGLGAGSLLLGSIAAKCQRPLKAYAALEALIGAGALTVTPLLHGFERVYPWLFEHFASRPGLFVFAKALLAFVSLALPTFCMGGTLPVLGQLVDGGERRLGLTAGLLYVANTFGAALGALAVPFLFLPMAGAKGTLWLCVAGNILVALAAWRLDQFWPAAGSETSLRVPKIRGERDGSLRRRPVLAFSLVSGLVTFALQVMWNRVFAQVHENSMFSFSAIIAIFILALATGAQFGRIALRRQFAPGRLLGWSWLLGGGLVALSPWLFLQLTGGLAYVPSRDGWSQYAGRLVVLAVAVLFVPVTLLGLGLPVLMEETGRRRDATAGDLLSRLLAVNVLGSVAGALVAGFFLPRLVDLWTSLLVIAAVLVVAGAWQFEEWPNKDVPAVGRCRNRSGLFDFRKD